MSILMRRSERPLGRPHAEWTCPSCDAASSRAFCPDCGERRPPMHALSARALVRELGEQVSSLDTKLVRTLALLFARPGALLVEYRRGARARYTSPLQLFIWMNVAFFVLVPALSIFDYRWRVARDFRTLGPGWWSNLVRTRLQTAGSPEALRVAFNASVGGHMQTLFGVIVPVLTLVLLVLYPRRRVLEHALMSTYLAPAFMAALVGSFVAPRLIGLLRVPTIAGQQVLFAALLLGAVLFGAHVAFALRRAYDDTWLRVIARAAVVAAGAAAFPSFYYLLVTYTTLILI